MLSANSEGASVTTLHFALILDIDVAAQELPAAIHAAQTCLPRQLPMQPPSNTAKPAGAFVLTLAPTQALLYISPSQSQAAQCLGFEAEEEASIGD
jgi:multidrug efflux pump